MERLHHMASPEKVKTGPKTTRKKASRPRKTGSARTRTGSRKKGGKEKKSNPPPPTLARTRRLLLAALRLWELKRGLRE
jgi:hypothetical protein